GVEIDGSNVVFKFEDAEKNVVARLKVEGITTTNPSPLASGQLANGQYYIAASTVGVAVNGGLDDAGEPILHTARISPMVIDASNFRSTGRVLPELPNSRANFFEELGIDPVLNGEGAIRGSKLSNNKKDARRAQNAAYFSTHGGFLDPDPRFLDVHNPGSEIRESLGVDRKEDHVGEEIAEKFGLKNGRVSVSAVYLDKNNKLYDEYRTGIFIKGIRGNITGTDANDIIVVPAPNEEKLRDLLAYGAAEITPDMPVYATVVDGRGGRNIVVSKGGDLYAREVTFLWRESETEGDRVYVHTSNKESHSHATFIHIGDEHPESVHLDNGDDVPAGSDKSEGIKDDWYEIPSKSNLTNTTQPDLPSGNWRQGDPEHIRNEMTAAQEEITNAVTELLKIDPMNSEIEIGEEWGKKFEELEASQNAFFDEWDFFNPMAGEDTGDVTDE
ncbi:MAG: hypothetical protein U1D33_00790, partial [bacterium]|nr:hypothetical protein [bacterium]